MNKSIIINEIFDLYKNYGHHDYIGEPVSQTEHMILAALVAEEEKYDDECILAAFFHDIGHLLGLKKKLPQMDSWGTVDHDKEGANYLREKGFTERLCSLVENHVLAKRYLVSTNKEYYNKLSEASKQTFMHQGGLMSSEELKQFEEDPLKDLYIKFREWEEKAKISRENYPSLTKYYNLCYKVLSRD